jgi:hypothetical protein
MKKIVLIGSLLVFVFLVIFIVSSPKPSDLEIEFVSELESDHHPNFKACILREDGKLVLLDIEKKNNENIYLYALKIYDHYRNSLPLKYSTPLHGNFEVKKLEKKGKELQIELEVLYLEENFNLFLTALMWTYQSMGIEAISLKANREIFHLKKNEIINPEIETFYPEKATKQIIWYYQEEVILPVTYLHQDDPTGFLIRKIISIFPEANFTYETYSGLLILRIEDPRYEITTDVINCLTINLKGLGLYDDIVIVKNGLLVYNN